MALSRSFGCCTNDDRSEEELFINCIRCNKSYHFVCLSIPEVASDSDAYLKWKCPGCLKCSSKSSKKDCTPKQNVSSTRGNKRPALNSPPEMAIVTADDVRSIVQEVIQKEIAAMMRQLNSAIVDIVKKELEPIKNEVADLKASWTFHCQEFEDFQKQHSDIKRSLKDVKEENDHLKGTFNDLDQRLNYLEQKARANNIEIQCLRESKQENLCSVTKQLGEVVGYKIKDSDILHSTRIAKFNPNNSRPRSVVVQLASPKIRDQFLASAIEYNRNNKQNKLNSSHLGISGTVTPIYVVEHLSPSNKALHAAARVKAKERGYRFVWVRNGRIFVKKNEEAEHIFVRNMDSLEKIL